MAELRWAVLCRRGIIDKHTNTLSLIEVMDRLSIEDDLPDPLPENVGITTDCHVVTMWSRSKKERPEKFWQTITITPPTGDAYPTKVSIEGDLEKHPRTRLLAMIKAIRYGGPGTYTFNLYYSRSRTGKRILVGSIPLEIIVKSATSSSELEQPPEQS